MKIKSAGLLFLLLGIAGAVNILPNPSFEVWLDTLGVNMPLGWLTSEFLYPGSAVKDTQSNSGDYCLCLLGGDTMAFATSLTVVRSGAYYKFSGFALVPGGLGGSFILQFLTMLGNPVGTPLFIPVYYSNSYRQYSHWVTTPDSAVFLSVSCLALPGAMVYFDDVTVDDTTLQGNQEEFQLDARGSMKRRKLVMLSRERWTVTDGMVYDVLGRRRADEWLNAGVYFKISP